MNHQTLESLEGLTPEVKVATILYSIDSAYPTQLTYVDVDFKLIESQIEAIESLSAQSRLELAKGLLVNLQQGLLEV